MSEVKNCLEKFEIAGVRVEVLRVEVFKLSGI